MLKKAKKIYSDIHVKRLISIFVVDLKYFTLNVAFWRFLCGLPAVKIKFPKIYIYFYSKLQRAIKSILLEKCHLIFDDFNKQNIIFKNGSRLEEKNIWVFWWQGEDNAPLLVKKCISSIRNNSGVDNVYILSKLNYDEYATIPEYIIKKFEKGQIEKAHFSDILRMALLCQHGGLWIDATVFCSKKLPDEIFNYPFFTCRNTNKILYNSNLFCWTPFIMGSQKSSPITELMLNSLLAYWKDVNLAIDYLFLDLILELIYENVPSIKEQIDNLACNNEQVLAMLKEMKSDIPYSKERLDDLLSSNTFFFKLSWKYKFKEFSNDGQKTLYYHFLNSSNDFLIK